MWLGLTEILVAIDILSLKVTFSNGTGALNQTKTKIMFFCN